MNVTTSPGGAPAETAGEPRQMAAAWREVAPDGGLQESSSHELGLDGVRLRSLYRLMALSRRVDRQAINLTRQGALGVFASSQGQEAAQVGAVFALEKDDWLFPSYRDTVGVFARGVDIVEILALFQGSWHCGFDPKRYRVAPLTTPWRRRHRMPPASRWRRGSGTIRSSRSPSSATARPARAMRTRR